VLAVVGLRVLAVVGLRVLAVAGLRVLAVAGLRVLAVAGLRVLAVAGLLTVPPVARSGDRPQHPQIIEMIRGDPIVKRELLRSSAFVRAA